MAYRSVEFSSFHGGLNLRDQPDATDPTQCVDVLNVDFTARGAIAQRSGYAFASAGTAANPQTIHPVGSSGITLIIGAGANLQTMDSANALSLPYARVGATAASRWNFVRFGIAGVNNIYFGDGTTTIGRYTPSGPAFAAPTATVNAVPGLAMPLASLLEVTPVTNRLVAGGYVGVVDGPNAAITNPSTVYFSEVNAPETWLTANILNLSPGDGEPITAIVSWGESVFIFKKTKFFVMYGESLNQSGTAVVFNYRTIDTGVGALGKDCVAVGSDGLYFMSAQGIYKTTGGAPVQVSDMIDPFFNNTPAQFFSSSKLNQAAVSASSMTWHQEKLYIAVPTGGSITNNLVLVYDLRNGWWSVWDIPMGSVCSTFFGSSSIPSLFFSHQTSAKIAVLGSSYKTDGCTLVSSTAGSAIPTKWVSGWFNLGSPSVKTLRETKLWGTGKLKFGTGVDYAGASTQQISYPMPDLWGDGTNPSDLWADGSDPNDVWGSGINLSVLMVREAKRGTVFAMTLTGLLTASSDNSFTITRIGYNMRETRVPSIEQGT